jgi:hypothetical protein
MGFIITVKKSKNHSIIRKFWFFSESNKKVMFNSNDDSGFPKKREIASVYLPAGFASEKVSNVILNSPIAH